MNLGEKVYLIVKKIPKGKVSTYKQIAERLNTKSYRAIGQILSQNKDKSIPCHRVVRSDGSVGGFRGLSDNSEKIRLLRKEGVEIKGNKIDLKTYLWK